MLQKLFQLFGAVGIVAGVIVQVAPVDRHKILFKGSTVLIHAHLTGEDIIQVYTKFGLAALRGIYGIGKHLHGRCFIGGRVCGKVVFFKSCFDLTLSALDTGNCKAVIKST